MKKKIGWLWLALVGAGIISCTSPLEQIPEKVVITTDPTIRLPLGDPLKGENSLGEELKKALDIDASSIGLTQLYDYTDPEAPQDRKFLWYQTLLKQEIALGEYKNTLQVGSDDLTGLPKTVNFKQYLPSNLPSLPVTLPTPIEIPLKGTITIEHEKIKEIQGRNSGLTLVCKGSSTIPDAIQVVSTALNLDLTKTKEKGEVRFGPAMTFTGDAFTLTQNEGIITIDINIIMIFREIVDTNDIGITPGFIFNWTQVELDLSGDIGADLEGSYPDTQQGEKPIDLSTLKESLFKGKLQFKTIPLYVYVNGPGPWFEDENIGMNLAAVAGETPNTDLHEGPISAVSLPVINPSGQSYAPKTGITRFPCSSSGELASVFNTYPEALGFEYSITIDRYIITPAMLQEDAITFEAAIAFMLPLDFTVVDSINLAEDMEGFSMPDFGEADLLGRDQAGASSQVFDFIKGIRLDMVVDNRLGLDGEIKLYANKIIQENKGDPLEILSLQGTSQLELTQEDLRETWPFSPAFDISIPEGKELNIKRTVSDNPFGLTLSIRLDGSITQEISL
ncbi:MAG: hypothetical protein LBF75_03170 [Treponema sp.]|jgi:hypothetical protein|nr:hypothetical protein [Treponema sp.]